ncbi:ABC-2 family transporter protein [Sporobacter termitidis DSM 10068]|uniref:ABC-2 family transporter protein n=1 Tax=Sporobacter termitidis DSM 10068 TaxID=1123282 RepID=A0A1M5VTV0_9FIRM|nr:ABC-2 transporter permease [Sporobacter termitidis]SHH78709.1 ABC-2 family transporter protein [Sporobacter termitidis DSM 10068]
MLYLIKKELTANVRYLLYGLGIFVVYMFIFAQTNAALFTTCLIISFYTVSTTNLVLDERYKIDLLLTTLPVRRKDIVFSKYLLILVIFVLSFLVYTLLFVVSQAAGYDKITALTPFSAAMGFLAISVFNGITLPLAYKFSAQTTRFVPFILFFSIFFLGSFLKEPDISGVTALFGNLSGGPFSLLLTAAALLVNAISCLITVPIYTKKDF